MFGKGKKIYEPRVRGEMLNLKQLGAECPAPPGLALLERRQQLDESQLTTVGRLAFLLRIALLIYIIVLFTHADSKFTVLEGLAVAAPFFLLRIYAGCEFKERQCILMGDVRCCLARVKESYDDRFADVDFSNGHTESQLFVYAADGRPVKPGDEAYVCVVESKDIKNMQFCEVRPAAELEKVSDRKSRKNQMR